MGLDVRAEIEGIARRFRAEGDAGRAAAERAYLKSELKFHGVGMPGVRAAAKELLARHPGVTRQELRALVDAAYRTDFHDLRSAAIAVMEKRVRLLEKADLPWLIELVRVSANWAHVDWLAVKMVGPVVGSDAKELARWAKDAPSFWVRRTALLAQLDELRGGRGDFQLFARIAAPMLGEKELFIRKAIGWVLREVSKKRPELVFDFLKAHEGEPSGLTFREASKYLPPAMQKTLKGAGRAGSPSAPDPEGGPPPPRRPGR
ncbi:MAG TPA: DNA alkylation repair protein [Myxococcaceae bacterium]|nr:DNA alkylation repair protein [Myxococcaceae bacterium]